MAAGDQVFIGNAKKATCLFTNISAANGQPSLTTDGIACYPDENNLATATGICFTGRAARESSLLIKVVASGGTVTGTFRLWGYHAGLAEWVPVGTGADTTKGIINGGAAIGATKTNKALHAEPFLLAGHFDRLYLECTAIGGTAAAAEAWLVCPRTVAY